MNDFMSVGVHRLWKDHYVRKLDPRGGLQCLDVAGGTGDIAQRILDHAKDKHYDRKTHVEMLDINPEMLEEGRKRFARTMYHDGMRLPPMTPSSLQLKELELLTQGHKYHSLSATQRSCRRSSPTARISTPSHSAYETARTSTKCCLRRTECSSPEVSSPASSLARSATPSWQSASLQSSFD